MSASRNILIWLGCLAVGTVSGGTIYLKSLPRPINVAIVPKVESQPSKKNVVPQYENPDLSKKEDLEPVESSKPVETLEAVETEPVEAVETERPTRKRLKSSSRNGKRINELYKGKSLYNATMQDWHQASYEDRLATAMLVVNVSWKKGLFKPVLQEKIQSEQARRGLADILVKEMDLMKESENAEEKEARMFQTLAVNETIDSLLIIMGWF